MTYLWSTGATSEDLSAVGAGTHTITITDFNGCTATASATVNEPTNTFTITIQTLNVSCPGMNDGSAFISVQGGSPLYSFIWNTGQTSQSIGNLGGGVYSSTATDAFGCTASASATISEPPAMTLTGAVTHVSCNATNDGAIDLTISGGTTPYSIVWSIGITTEDLTDLTGGTYSVTVGDANGCPSTASFTVNPPSPMTLSSQVTDVTTVGGSDGQVDLVITGGQSPLSFVWSNGGTTEDLTNLQAGTYCVTVADGSGCSANTCATVNQPGCIPINITLTTSDVSCNGGSDGSISLSGSGGTPPYSFLWSSGQQTVNLNNIPSGFYQVTITDNVGCNESAYTTVNEPSALTSSNSSTNILCWGDGNGTIDLTVNGGTTPYFFLWSNGATTQDLASLSGGAYSVTATDANGCMITENAIISEPSALASSITTTDVNCNGGADGEADLTVTGGTAPYNYLWSNGSTAEDETGLNAGSYSVTATDANGCTIFEFFTISPFFPFIL